MLDSIKNIRLIFVDPINNNNKFYNLDMFDDRLEANWGRVGATGQFKTFTNEGEKKFDSIVKSKKKKGYVEQQTVQSDKTISNNVGDNELQRIAKEQINTSSTVAEQLIDRLIKANIHQITSKTQISFDDGIFQTPLGVVTKGGIEDAEKLLDKMKNLKDKKCDSFYKYGGEFLKLIPQKVGRSVKTFIEDNYTTEENIGEQNDILNSLKVSLQCIEKTDTNKSDDEILEEVFNVSIEVLDDSDEYKRLSDYFYNSKKSMHSYNNIKVANIYTVNIKYMNDGFDKNNLGNIQEFYHGTSISNCLSILKSGLKVAPPSSAKIAGKMFGNGVYGATCSSKSLGYSLGRWGQSGSNDSAWLFVCDFAMGVTQYVKGAGSKYPHKGYDSVSALTKNTSLYNDEFIVYTNEQVNIKYLIECST